MALTRVTTSVISSNVVTSDTIGNNIIQERHIQLGAITSNALSAEVRADFVETRLNANLDIVQSNVVATQSNVNTVQSNLNLVQDNVLVVDTRAISYATYANGQIASLGTQIDDVESRRATNTAIFTAAFTGTNAAIVATEARVNANLDVVQDNVVAITGGSTQFTTNKIFQQNVTIQGNLIVVGAQVDLGVGTATIDDNFIVVSANLTGTPATDSGIIVNRGAEGNVFIGDHIAEDGIVFALTQSPHDNATIAIQEYLDVHANAFHATSGLNFSRAHVAHREDESTGIIFDTTNTHIKFIVSGTEQANINSSGNLFLSTGIIHGPSAANTLDLDDDELGDRQNSITLRSLQSVGIFLDSNDSETGNFFNIYDAQDDPNAVGIDDGIFSVRDTGEVFITDDISVEGNANILLDAVVSNAVIGTRVFEGTVGLQANDSATLFSAYANDFITYTRLNANVNSVQSNLSTAHTSLSSNINTVQNNVDAITGGATLLSPFVNTNSASGTSNVFFLGRDVASYGNIITVTLDGVFQANTEYVANFSNDTIQFTDATIPSGTIVTTFVLA